MKLIFPDGQVFYLRKIPFKNVIEARTDGKKLLYERVDREIVKISEETDEREPFIITKIHQYFMPEKKHYKHWAK